MIVDCDVFPIAFKSTFWASSVEFWISIFTVTVANIFFAVRIILCANAVRRAAYWKLKQKQYFFSIPLGLLWVQMYLWALNISRHLGNFKLWDLNYNFSSPCLTQIETSSWLLFVAVTFPEPPNSPQNVAMFSNMFVFLLRLQQVFP